MPVRHALLTLVFLTVSVSGAIADEHEKTLFAEAFTDKLADGWTWLREDPKGWRLDKGTLIVRTSTGGLWQKENDGRNLLLRTPPRVQDGKLAVEVLVDIEPTNLFENAGLIWYYDDDNYVIMVKEKIGNEIHMQFVAEKDGQLHAGVHKTLNDAKSVRFRMVVEKGEVTGSYRISPREDWVRVGQCSLPVRGEPKVGLTTAYAPKDAEHFTRFSNLRMLQIP